MEHEELETIDDKALNDVSGGCFGMGWMVGAVVGGFMLRAGLIGFRMGVAERDDSGSKPPVWTGGDRSTAEPGV